MDHKGCTNIKVAIRIRPLIPTEKENKLKPQWSTQDNIIYQIDDNGQQFGEVYSFDHIFDMNKTNLQIYNDIVRDFVISSLDGLNSTIFAYGQTSSGKTYTMLGDKKDTGIMSQAIENIFSSIESNNSRKYLIRVSYIEIYNEKINDLLDPKNKDVKIREFYPSTVGLQNIKEELVSTRDQMYDCLKRGNLNRRIGSTKANDRSSRSHTIFKITIESTLVEDGGNGCVQISNLNLVDLAGSERVAQTKATGMRLKEGGHINKSLSALGLVIKQLSDGQEFVNFRDSKLTRLLQDSLGGNSKTLIIATITVASTEDTSSTLAFAQRAKTVKNKPRVNEILTDADRSKRYAAINTELQKKIDEQLLINQRLQRTQEENVREITRLQQQIEIVDDFQNGKKTLTKTIPNRRHTIGFTAQKRLFQKISFQEVTKSTNYTKEIEMFENLISKESFNVSTGSTVAGLETIMEEEPPASNKILTPENCLRLRLSALEQDYNELATFTRDEENIFNETAKKADELQEKLIQIQNELEVERDFKNRFKVREDELCSRIHELEEEIQKNHVTQPVLNSTECTQIMDQLICLQDILSNTDFFNDFVQVKENSVLQIIEKFNAKLKTSKDIIENEILKEIHNFDRGSHISLPNELQSFNDLLNELSLFESDIPVDLINNMKMESIEHFKILIKVYESLLRKNEFIKICSDRIKGLEKNSIIIETEKESFLEKIENMNCTITNHNQQINDLNSIIVEKENIISLIEDECTQLKDEKEKLNIELLNLVNNNNNLQQELQQFKIKKEEEIQTLQEKIEKLTLELEEFSDNLIEKESLIDNLKDNKELINLTNRIEQLSQEITNKEADFNNQKSQLILDNKNLKEELTKIESKLQVVENQKTLLAESENNCTTLKLELKTLRKQLSPYKENQSNLIKHIIQDKNQIKTDIETNFGNFKIELQNCIKFIGTLEEHNNELTQNYNRILSENQSLKLNEGELTKLRNTLDQLSIEMIEKDKLIVKSRDINQNLEEVIGNLNKDLESSESDNKFLKYELEKIHNVCHSSNKKIDELEAEIDLLNLQIQEKVISLDELEKLYSDLKRYLDWAKSDTSGSSFELQKLSSEIQAKDKLIIETENNLENLKIELKKSQQYSCDIVTEKKCLESKLEELEKSNGKLYDLEAKSEILLQENKSLKSDLSSLENKLKDIKSKLEVLSLEIIDKDKVIYEYQNANTKLKVEVENLMKNSNKFVIENESLKKNDESKTKEIQSLHDEIDKLNVEVRKKSKSELELQTLRNKNSKILQQNKSLQLDVTDLKKKIDDLNSELDKLSVVRNNLELDRVELNRKSHENEELKKQIEKLNGSITDRRDQRLIQSELKIQRLKQLLNNAQTQNVELKESVKEKEKFKSELSGCKMQLLLYKTKQEEYMQLNEKLSSQVKELENKIMASNDSGTNHSLDRSTQDNNLSELHCFKEKFEGFLSSIIEQYIIEQKTILYRRHSQNERDYFKNILKDLKLSNTVLKNQLNLLKTQKSFDLNEINQQLLKTRGNFKEYCEAEKGLLQKQIDQLESNNKAYLDEMIVLKNTRQNSTNCTNCESLKTELMRLSKLINLQEENLNSLKNKNASLGKENIDRIKQIANLQVQIYSEQDRKAEVQYSDYLKFYQENDKMQQKQIQMLQEKVENYRNKSMRNKQSIKIQCNLIPEESTQQDYNNMKQTCLIRQQEIAALKLENSQLKTIVDNNNGERQNNEPRIMCSAEVQCNILDMEKYVLTKKVCKLRSEEIAVLQAELNALKMTK